MAVIIKKQVDVTGLAFDPGFQYRAVLIFQMYGDLAAVARSRKEKRDWRDGRRRRSYRNMK